MGMMRGSSFDEKGVCHAMGWPGKMLVSMEFDSRDDEKTDLTVYFNKHERFLNIDPLGLVTLWDMVQNFGYHHEDGKSHVYHQCEYFYGPFPIRLLFQVHANYVIWATRKFVESPTFGSDE